MAEDVLGHDGAPGVVKSSDLGKLLPWPKPPSQMNQDEFDDFVQSVRAHPPGDLTPSQIQADLAWGRREAVANDFANRVEAHLDKPLSQLTGDEIMDLLDAIQARPADFGLPPPAPDEPPWDSDIRHAQEELGSRRTAARASQPSDPAPEAPSAPEPPAPVAPVDHGPTIDMDELNQLWPDPPAATPPSPASSPHSGDGASAAPPGTPDWAWSMPTQDATQMTHVAGADPAELAAPVEELASAPAPEPTPIDDIGPSGDIGTDDGWPTDTHA